MTRDSGVSNGQLIRDGKRRKRNGAKRGKAGQSGAKRGEAGRSGANMLTEFVRRSRIDDSEMAEGHTSVSHRTVQRSQRKVIGGADLKNAKCAEIARVNLARAAMSIP
eukprot:Nk52_evm1s2532 gene=Nk52_evmTU1s2532